MVSSIEIFLENQNFARLRRACIWEINSLGNTLPQSLVPKIQSTTSSESDDTVC